MSQELWQQLQTAVDSFFEQHPKEITYALASLSITLGAWIVLDGLAHGNSPSLAYGTGMIISGYYAAKFGYVIPSTS